jgi:DNA-binding MarR family transcriptional regulator
MKSLEPCSAVQDKTKDETLTSTLDLLLIVRSIEANLSAIVAQSGLSLLQINTLYTLSDCQEGNMRSLAYSLACDPSHVTGIIDKLLQMGLVERNECPEDRRKKRVHLSDEGLRRIGQVIDVFPESSTDTKITKEELAELRRILLKLNDLFAEMKQNRSAEQVSWAPPYVPSNPR